MYKIIFLLIIVNSLSFSSEQDTSILSTGVEINHINHTGEKESIIVKREIDPKCKQIHISNDMFWRGKYASHEVSNACKSTFITSAGKIIFPMKIHKDVETYGEMEVMAFIKKMQDDTSMLFIDTRDEEWYGYRTIPSAENMHYVYITMPKVFEEEYRASLTKLGVVQTGNFFDFSKAKTLLVFCNGAWCSQSPKMIKALLAIGYPPEKIKWYRGGMDDWLGLSMTTTRA
jgi:rhodanese-related sulfurtransferase